MMFAIGSQQERTRMSCLMSIVRDTTLKQLGKFDGFDVFIESRDMQCLFKGA